MTGDQRPLRVKSAVSTLCQPFPIYPINGRDQTGAVGPVGATNGHPALALQLPFMQVSESMGNHDSKIVDAASVD
ncbi:hypothetical protein SAMN05443247_07184 [Bradyrhizobium erythrophlei]|nr:hypothetical protein SAMN05443247_07184 [Bradyrhizobium erythrophlei]